MDYAGVDRGTPLTTLMVRNIPASYTKAMLFREWECEGRCDFLYLPRNCASKVNLSYAFVNFLTERGAADFRARWHKARLVRFRAQKVLNIVYADVQGLAANIRRLEQKRNYCDVKGCQCEPVVTIDGRRVPRSSLCQGVPASMSEAAGSLGEPEDEAEATLLYRWQ